MKAVFITNIPAPYQIRFCEVLKEYGDVTYIFCSLRAKDRPQHWNLELSDNCLVLDPKKKIEFGTERYLNRDICAVLSKIQPDIVMGGGFATFTNMLAYRWALRNKKKYVVFSEISRNPSNLKIYKKIYRHLVALLLCGSAAEAQFSKVFCNTPIYNFTYPADLGAKLKIEKSYCKNTTTFLYASRFVPEFCPQLCIEAFKEVYSENNNIRMIMSSYGPLLEECKKLVSKYNLNDVVEFRLELKQWGDVNQLFADSDILLYPAEFAGWGLVIPEAMAAGMPVITTRGVGASDLVDDEQIIDGTEEALITAMKQYASNPSLVERIGRKNKKNVKCETFEEKSKQLVDIFDEINNW